MSEPTRRSTLKAGLAAPTVVPAPTPSWVAQEVPDVLRVFGNTQAVMNSGRWKFKNSIANIPNWLVTGPPTSLQELLGFYPGPVVGGDVVQTEDGYRAVFTKPVLSPPDIADTYRTQATFAEQFVAGPDPTRLVRMTSVPSKFPITSDHLATVPELGAPDLHAAMAAGRVYWVDYALTEGLKAGKHTDGREKYMYTPMIALCVTADGKATLPFAIQCGQAPRGRRIYTPADGYSWLLARNTVQVAHHTVHEAITHLTNTHLVAGRVLESAAVHLTKSHPVEKLMARHFAGMPFINAQVPVLLTPKGGWFDLMTAATVPSMNDFIAKHLNDFSFQGAALPKQFSAHKTGDAKALSHYPYRDDGMLVWNAISAWITDFVGAFYSSDAKVRADAALQSFAKHVKLRDFGPTPGGISDRQGLVEILTTLVWITGPQHAAVNFSQADWMSFCPAAPMTGFTPEPHGTGHTEQDWMDNYPPADIAVLQVGATHLLVGARTTRIGEYGLDFAVTCAHLPAQRFKKALRDAEATINDRNTRRARPYTYLQPSKVPSSISI